MINQTEAVAIGKLLSQAGPGDDTVHERGKELNET